MTSILNYIFLILVFTVVRCSVNVAGGGSDLPDKNVVVGTIYSTDKVPAANTQVVIIPAGYNSLQDASIPPEQIDTTDVAGNFAIKGCRTGEYNIQAVHISERTRLLITGVSIGEDTTTVPAGTLQIPGAVKVFAPDSAGQVSYQVYLSGTTIAGSIAASTPWILLDSVPAGIIPRVCFTQNSDSAPVAIRYNLNVRSRDTAVVAQSAWSYSQRLRLNTAASGADVQGDVFNVPVLVRLNSDNFDFSEAAPNGADLRFTKSDTISLPYEIERWDAASENADLWVKIDTIYGNDSIQAITMLWGNPEAASTSNCTAVFDTADGFAGVWHLSETSGTSARDASSGLFTGAYKGGLPRSEQGPSGVGQTITSVDTDYVDMGDMLDPEMRSLSISVWIKRGMLSGPQALIAKTNGELPKTSYGYLLSIDPGNYPHFNIATGGADWGEASTFQMASDYAIDDTTSWHHVFAVIDRSGNERCKVYVDGIDRTSTSASGDITSVAGVSNTLNLRIGTESDGNVSYKGAVDEAVIAFTARSADWVKLCYMNQKIPDALVAW